MNKIIPAVLMALACAACNVDSSGDTPPPKKEGREETKNIRNLDAVGYSGSAIANRVDQSLDATDKHNEEMKKAEEAANPQQ